MSCNYLVVLAIVCCSFQAQASPVQSLKRSATAYVAFEQLSPQDRSRVHHLLAQHPCYSTWESEAASQPASARINADLTIMLIAATGEVEPTADMRQADARPCEQQAAVLLNSDAAGRLAQSQFHMPTSMAPAIEREIILLQNLLISRAGDTLKACALVRLIRLIADIHERLECTYAGSTPTATTPIFEPDEKWKDWIESHGGITEAGVHLGTMSLQIEAPSEKEDLAVADWVDEGCDGARHPDTAADQITQSTARRIEVAGIRLAAVIHEDLAMLP